jgi:hypothetical protein
MTATNDACPPKSKTTSATVDNKVPDVHDQIEIDTMAITMRNFCSGKIPAMAPRTEGCTPS